MINLRTYITERLVLSKTKLGVDDLSNIDLNNNQCIIRLGEFYKWYWGVATFKDLKKDLGNFEYCCGNMKGEFNGSPEELIDYLFKFVKNKEDYAICTIITKSGDWEFEIVFKDIEFNETSVDPLPKKVIHRLPDNFDSNIELSESLLNERLVISKHKDVENVLDILDKDKFEDEYKSLKTKFARECNTIKIKDITEYAYYVVFEETSGAGRNMIGVKYFKILEPVSKHKLYATYDVRAFYTYDKLSSVKLVKEWERGKPAEILPRKSKYNNIERFGIYEVSEGLLYIVKELIDYYKEKNNIE